MKKITWFVFVLAILSSSFAHAQYLYVDLNPSWATESYIFGVSAFEQVGQALSGRYRAVRWQGSPGSATILGGTATVDAAIRATDGTQQVGYDGSIPTRWTGTAASKVALRRAPNISSNVVTSLSGQIYGGYALRIGTRFQPGDWIGMYWPSLTANPVLLPPPSGFVGSDVYAISTSMQAGDIFTRNDAGEGVPHGATWEGSTQSVVDRHPPYYATSAIRGIAGRYGVGWASETERLFDGHAALWDFFNNNFSDLHPWEYYSSVLWAISGTTAVGSVTDFNGYQRATLWNVTTHTTIDLQQFLPAGQYIASEARAIKVGTGCGGTQIGGYAVTANYEYHAILWYTPWC
jgi:hypothetical protein